jgi:chemotaxis protein MotB
MSEGRQPLTDHLSRSNRGGSASSATRAAWITVAVLVVALGAALLMWAIAVGDKRALEAMRPDLDAANQRLAAAQDQIQKDKDQMDALQSQIADLQQATNSAAQMANGLESEMRNDLQSRDVTISNLQGRLTVTILDNVMFDSGEAILKPDGQSVMRKIAAILAEHTDLKIHVIGYTDNVPIRPERHARFASNWELSTARALAAVHYLTEQAGVDPRRVGAVGYGEFRPVADNSTAEGRAKNRRIAITILPAETSAPDIYP